MTKRLNFYGAFAFGLGNSRISNIYNDNLFLLFCLLRILWFQSKGRLDDHGQHQEEDGEAGQRDC